MKRIAVVCGLFVPIAVFSAVTATAQSQPPVKLEVDLRDAPRRIYHSKMEFSVKPGPFTLVYPKWIPGEHSPSGPIEAIEDEYWHADDEK